MKCGGDKSLTRTTPIAFRQDCRHRINHHRLRKRSLTVIEAGSRAEYRRSRGIPDGCEGTHALIDSQRVMPSRSIPRF
jgi:hypothetical protein